EVAGASSFRAFVDRLTAEAERGDAAEAPVVEEGAEGVRIMSVHKAKGLEFPVVILCDPCAPAAPRLPSRFVDPARRVWAMPLAVPPGLHRPRLGGHQVVWWDPRSLELDREVENWMRERDLLLVDEGAARVAAQGHEQWQKRRSDTVERGQRPSLHVETATARASSTAAEAVELAAVEVRTSSPSVTARAGRWSISRPMRGRNPTRSTPRRSGSTAARSPRLPGCRRRVRCWRCDGTASATHPWSLFFYTLFWFM